MSNRRERQKPFLLPRFCKGCGRCIESCAKQCIELAPGIDPRDGPRARGAASGGLHGLRPLHRCLSRAVRPAGDAPGAEAGFELQDPEKLFGSRGSTAPTPVAIPDRVVALPPLAPLVVKGNYASAIGALLAGCRHVFGYPITPSTEGAELMAKLLPDLGGVFLQAVSEVATVNMMYGCGGAGLPCMTFTSSPGFSLMLEGISYMIGAEVPGRVRQRDAGRPRSRQHRPRASGHQARLPRTRPRQHARHRAGAFDPAGDARPDAPRLRTLLQVPQPGHRPERRIPGPDDGKGRSSADDGRSPASRSGRSSATPATAQTSSTPFTSPRWTSRTTTGTERQVRRMQTEQRADLSRSRTPKC